MSAVDEGARHELYQAIEDLIGSERAGTLMSLLPPVGWADVATKHDLEGLRVATKHDLEALRVATKHDLEALEERMELRFELLDQKFETFRHQFREELERGLKNQARTLFLGMLAALATMTSLCLGAITLVV